MPNEVCSKCHEDFMNCKCDSFHPNVILSDEYRCAFCNGIFKLVRDETWSPEKAEEEYKKYFPKSSRENRDIVCDDCWQIVKPR